MTINLITSNVSKYEEIKKILAIYHISVKRINFDIPEIKSISAEEVIIDKIKKAFKKIRKPVIVDDTGIFFKKYNNFPGTISRFIFTTLGYHGIFKLIKHKHPAHFKSYIGYLDNKIKKPIIFSGECHGTLIKKIKGKKRKKMPYDNIFIPHGEKITFSQMGVERKQKYDHRSKAVRKLANYLLGKKNEIKF